MRDRVVGNRTRFFADSASAVQNGHTDAPYMGGSSRRGSGHATPRSYSRRGSGHATPSSYSRPGSGHVTPSSYSRPGSGRTTPRYGQPAPQSVSDLTAQVAAQLAEYARSTAPEDPWTQRRVHRPDHCAAEEAVRHRGRLEANFRAGTVARAAHSPTETYSQSAIANALKISDSYSHSERLRGMVQPHATVSPAAPACALLPLLT